MWTRIFDALWDKAFALMVLLMFIEWTGVAK